MLRNLRRAATHSQNNPRSPNLTPTRALAAKGQDTASQLSILPYHGVTVESSERLPATPANDVWSSGAPLLRETTRHRREYQNVENV